MNCFNFLGAKFHGDRDGKPEDSIRVEQWSRGARYRAQCQLGGGNGWRLNEPGEITVLTNAAT